MPGSLAAHDMGAAVRSPLHQQLLRWLVGGGVYLAMTVLDMAKRRNTILAVLAGILVYVVLVFAFGALRREDMEQIPGGNKLERLLVKLHVWR